MNIVKVTRFDAECEGIVAPFQYSVQQGGLQIGWFQVDDYPSAEDARAAALALAKQLETNPWVSPFKTHRDVVLADYGTAGKLRSLVMGLWNGHGYPFDLSSVSGFDKRHFAIAIELIQSYHRLGENDKAFMALAEEIWQEFYKDKPTAGRNT